VRDPSLAVFRNFDPSLPPGLYRARLDGVTDRSGLPLDQPREWDFEVYGGEAEDSDGDDLPDRLEALLGLDPTVVDSDGDGTPDGLEDFDGDGLVNAGEAALGRDPRNPDSTGTGVADGDLDPDQDRLGDGGEFLAGTSPFVVDTDGDGFDDSSEVAAGSDPLDPASSPVRATVERHALLNEAVTRPLGTRLTLRNDAAPEEVARTTRSDPTSVSNEAP